MQTNTDSPRSDRPLLWAIASEVGKRADLQPAECLALASRLLRDAFESLPPWRGRRDLAAHHPAG